MVPTPPATPPTRICCAPLALMLVNLFVLRAALKSAVHVKPPETPRSTRAERLSSRPLFCMVPMLVVKKFEKFVPAAIGTVKIRSLVFLT